MNQLLIATNNQGKVKELHELLLDTGIQLVTPADIHLDLDVHEDGSTYAENASTKAIAFAQASGLISLADDSGLEVDVLDGAPGLYSARYGSTNGEKLSDAGRRQFLRQNLKDKPRPGFQDPQGRPEGLLRRDARPQGQAGVQHPGRLRADSPRFKSLRGSRLGGFFPFAAREPGSGSDGPILSAMPKLILVNKPYGFVCQFTPSGAHRTLAALVPVPGVYPAGRLDTDSEGLLVLTDDGALQARIADPRHKLEKGYWVQVEGAPGPEALERLRRGVDLGDFVTRPACADHPADKRRRATRRKNFELTE